MTASNVSCFAVEFLSVCRLSCHPYMSFIFDLLQIGTLHSNVYNSSSANVDAIPVLDSMRQRCTGNACSSLVRAAMV